MCCWTRDSPPRNTSAREEENLKNVVRLLAKELGSLALWLPNGYTTNSMYGAERTAIYSPLFGGLKE